MIATTFTRLKPILLIGLFFSIGFVNGQTITISSTGQTGTSGTNWSSSGINPVTITATGDANINASVVVGYLNAGKSVIINSNSNIQIDNNIVSTSANSSSLTFKANFHIVQAAGVTISTNGGSVTYWTDSDNNGSGNIFFSGAASVSTNGGNITLAGGADSGGSPAGYTSQIYATGHFTASSNGGNILLKSISGSVYTSSYFGSGDFNAGSGSITFDAQQIGTQVGLFFSGPVNITSTKNSGTAISLTGTANSSYGVLFNSVASTVSTIKSTGGGAIIINGSSVNPSSGSIPGIYLFADVLSSSGAITINGGAAGIVMSSSGTSVVGQKTGQVNTSSSNISVVADRIDASDPNTLLSVVSSGTGSITSSGASFSNTLDLTRITFGNTLSGLTLGKPSNTSDIGIGANTSIAGPVNVFANAIFISADLNTTNTTTGDVTFNAATVTGTGNITLASGRSLSVTQSANSTYSGIISGTGSSLTKLGAGTLTLTGANSYTGATNITTGILQVGDGGTTGTLGTGNIFNNVSLNFNRSNDLTVGSDISGTGTITKLGASTLTLTGSNSYNGITTISAGTLQIGAGGTNGSLGTASVVNNGTLSFNRSDDVTISNTISGTGLLTKLGANTLTLTANNTYNDVTTIDAGTLILQHNAPNPTSKTFTGTGALVIESSGTAFTSAFSTLGWNFGTTLSALTIGKSTNTSDVTLGSTTTINGPISVANAGFINITANITSLATNGIGISFNAKRIQQTNQAITTSGANIVYTVTGTNHDSNNNFGIDFTALSNSRGSISAGGGNITLSASFAAAPGAAGDRAIRLQHADITTTGTGTINILGDATNNITNASVRGIQITNVTLESVNGAINVTGTAGLNAANRGVEANTTSFRVLSQSGAITISDLMPTGSTAYNGMYLRPNVANAIIFGASETAGATSSSSVTLRSDKITFDALNSVIKTTGDVVIESIGDIFQSDLTSFNFFSISQQLSPSSFRLGKTTNTSNITIGSATTIAGPITVYGGTIAVNENLSSSNGSTIALYGNSLSVGANKTITSSGQLIIAPQTAATTIGLAGALGTLSIPSSYFSTNFTDGFSNIQIGSTDQTGAIATNTFTLRDNMTFLTSGALTLGGKPVLGSNHLTLGTGITTINVGSPANYFQTNSTGTVKRTIANNVALLFPIGNAAYNPLTITNKNAASDLFSARLADLVYLNGGSSGTLITTPHVKATWNISKTMANTGSGVDFTFGWESSQEQGLLTTFGLNHYNSIAPASWELAAGTSGTPSGTTTKTITHTGYTGTFSPFAIGESGSALPVELTAFSAVCNEAGVEVAWQTASEHNTGHFDVEKSRDGNTWEMVTSQVAAGNSNTVLNYSFLDTEAADLVYYRLIQQDQDGQQKLYGPISANCEFEGLSVLTYPNPSSDYVNVMIESDKAIDKATIVLKDQLGRLVYGATRTIERGTTQLVLNDVQLAPGVYTFALAENQLELHASKHIVR